MYMLVIILASASVIFSVATVVGARGKGQKAPRRLRRSARWSLLACAAICASVVVPDLVDKHVTYSTFAAGGCGLLILLLSLWKSGSPERFSEAEAAANYAADRQHCGQCEYDLTGNVSGICPECGWHIPRQLPAVADGELQALWWRPWRIEHLRSWRRTLWETVLFTAMFAGAAALVDYLGNPLGGIVLGLLALVFLVNVGRVIAYGRRHGRCRPG